eukprot:4547505-Alexandrium_andersonii.AAC.1
MHGMIYNGTSAPKRFKTYIDEFICFEVELAPDCPCRGGWAAQPPGDVQWLQAFGAWTARPRKRPQNWFPELPRSALCAVLRAECDRDNEKRRPTEERRKGAMSAAMA